MATERIINLGDPIGTQDAVTKGYLEDNYYTKTTPLNSITAPTGTLSLNSHIISNLANAAADGDALNRITADGRYYLATTTLNSITAPSGNLSMNSHIISNLATPSSSSDAATKGYVDSNSQSQTAADARYYLNTTTLDNITQPAADVTLNSHKLTNVADPSGN